MQVQRDALICFFLKFGVMLANGVPLGRALDLLSGEVTDVALRSVVKDLSDGVSRGADLSSAMALRPDVFDPGVLSLAKAAEQAGAADLVFRNIAEYLVYARLPDWKRACEGTR